MRKRRKGRQQIARITAESGSEKGACPKEKNATIWRAPNRGNRVFKIEKGGIFMNRLAVISFPGGGGGGGEGREGTMYTKRGRTWGSIPI